MLYTRHPAGQLCPAVEGSRLQLSCVSLGGLLELTYSTSPCERHLETLTPSEHGKGHLQPDGGADPSRSPPKCLKASQILLYAFSGLPKAELPRTDIQMEWPSLARTTLASRSSAKEGAARSQDMRLLSLTHAVLVDLYREASEATIQDAMSCDEW